MTMPEILRRKLMERIDIASEPDDGEVLEEIDGLILGEEETRYLPVAQKAELRRQLFYSVRRLDVLQELRSMKAWCDANPKQRKTRSGASRFIVSWLTREQNRGGSAKSSPPARSRGYQTAAEYNAEHGGPQRDDAALARRVLDRSRDDTDRLRRQLDAQKEAT